MNRELMTLVAFVAVSACSRSQAPPQTAAPAPGDSAAAAAPAQAAPQRRPRYDRSRLTAEELAAEGQGMLTLYDYVIAKRNEWIRSAGGGRLATAPRGVSVYVDGVRLGNNPEAMRQIPIGSVYLARKLGPSEAAGKYGLDNNAGTIEVFTTRERVR